MESGVDLIVGHGAHMIQEIEKLDDRWVLYNIGNFMFNSKGRYKQLNAPPYSYIAKLDVSCENGILNFTLRAYPILTNNLITNYQPRFLNEYEFKDLYATIKRKTVSTKTVFHSLTISKDNYGYFLELEMSSNSTVVSPNPIFIGLICRVIRVKVWIITFICGCSEQSPLMKNY